MITIERHIMDMHNPAHPGELLTGWLEDLNITVTAFAAHIGISRIMLSRLLHGHSGITADMDLRLSEALGTSPGYWLALQAQRDLWMARENAKKRQTIQRMAALELAHA
ncbi:MAG: HigA family addiction module antitoxin [Giesbergeria sp.]|nr:HigA family addiction module antitoxin [Giesbergeria sp.]